MAESEAQTRKKRIDEKLKSAMLGWKIIPWKPGLDTSKLEAHYQNAKVNIDKLSQSVLAKAFRGELVPQDPGDEPAEKLLERIKEEKEKLEGEGKKAGKSAGRKLKKFRV